MSKLLTLKEIAKQLGIPESSLRKYREIFSRFIPSVGTGRSRRYRQEAIGILAEIRDMREDMHMPWDAIADKLAEKYPMDATPEDGAAPEDAPAAVETAAALAVPSSDQLIKRMSAISERQAMMVNALAMEIIRSMETLRGEARKDSVNLQMNFVRAMQDLAESLSAANQQEQALLRDIQGRVAALGKKISAPAPPPVQADNGAAARIADLNKKVALAREQLLKKDKTIEDYKHTIESIKEENAKLMEMRRQYSKIVEKENEQSEPQEHHRRRSSSSSSSSSSGKPSVFKKMLGFK